MLTEETVIDAIEVTRHGSIQVRRATIVRRDGRQIAEEYHRVAYAPGETIDHEDARVQAHAAVAWTPDVLAAHRLRTTVDAVQAEMEGDSWKTSSQIRSGRVTPSI